jgi:SpoVK/Ycf46/Vps4 family AAA+-type ATPase
VLLLRPGSGFETDDLEGVIRRWSEQAPAVLVVEDLDWLLKQVNVSTFLNLLDGVESAVSGGLLLIATTNHPDALDPAVNNRPGRFDVVMEVASPDEALRLRFLTQRLPDASAESLREAARATSGLAFAHLHEVLRLSGFLALAAGRSARTDDDVVAAARQVRQAHDDARRGFPTPLEMPFGLAHIRAARRDQQSQQV